MVNSLLISCFEGYELAKQEVFPVSPVEFVAVMDFVAQHDMDSDLVRRSLYEADEPALRRFGIQIAIMESEHQEYMGDIRFMIGPIRSLLKAPKEKPTRDWMDILYEVASTITFAKAMSEQPDPSAFYRHEQYAADRDTSHTED